MTVLDISPGSAPGWLAKAARAITRPFVAVSQTFRDNLELAMTGEDKISEEARISRGAANLVTIMQQIAAPMAGRSVEYRLSETMALVQSAEDAKAFEELRSIVAALGRRMLEDISDHDF